MNKNRGHIVILSTIKKKLKQWKCGLKRGHRFVISRNKYNLGKVGHGKECSRCKKVKWENEIH